MLAADLVSLAAALVLYLLAVGTVRGFAFFLGLATLLDIFTTFFFTRPLVIWLGRNSPRDRGAGDRHRPRPGHADARARHDHGRAAPSRSGLPAPASGRTRSSALYRGETSFDFVGRRRWWYALSGLVIVAGLVSLGISGFNCGIDFKGGTSWEIPAHGVTFSQVTKAVAGGRRARRHGARSSARGAVGHGPGAGAT